jgi:hypothetical protein
MASGSMVSKTQPPCDNGGLTIRSIDTIGNELQSTYLKEVSLDVLSLENGKVGEILDKFSVWNWTIKEAELPDNMNALTTFKNGKVTTMLNRGSLGKATKLSVARTIIHELIHAYLSLHFQYESRIATVNYPGMMKAWLACKKPDLNKVQHEEIKRSFITEIATALMEYDQVSGSKPDDDSVYFDLSWGGLDFAGHHTLTKNDKRRIQKRLMAEQFASY